MKKVGNKQDSTMKTKQTLPGSIFFSGFCFFKGRVIQPPKKSHNIQTPVRELPSFYINVMDEGNCKMSAGLKA